MGEAVQIIGKVAKAPWQAVETGLSAQVVSPEWKMTKGVGTGDMCFELAELVTDEDDEDDHSWLAAAVKAGSTQLCIEVAFRRGLQDQAEAVIRESQKIAPLSKFGFLRDEIDLRLFIPIVIPAEKLAQGFEQNDLTLPWLRSAKPRTTRWGPVSLELRTVALPRRFHSHTNPSGRE